MAAPTMIEAIKILRERTGAGMMDCKKALEESNMDLDKACDWLREKGIAKAAKKNEHLIIKGGIVDGKVLTADEMKVIATLPGRDGLISMLLSCLQAPVRKFACAVQAIADKEN